MCFNVSTRNSLWKYAITTCDNNTELKVWCCATWECMQTVRFQSVDEQPMFFKAEIDPTSSYLILAESTNRGLYVLQIMQNNDEDTKSESENGKSNDEIALNGTKPLAFIKSVSEFPVSLPILSFGIVDATIRKYKCAYDVYLLEDLDDYDEDHFNRYCVVIHMFLVSPKSVQECHVLYQPSLSINADVGSSVSVLTEETNDRDEELSNELANILNIKPSKDETSSSISANTNAPQRLILDSSLLSTGSTSSTSSSSSTDASKNALDATKSESNTSKPTSTKQPSTLNLLTPDSFQSTGKTEGVSNEVYATLRILAGEKPNESANLLQLVSGNKKIHDDKVPLLQQLSDDNEANNDDENASKDAIQNIASAGSSPSREVQQILSPNVPLELVYDDLLSDTDGSGNNGDAVDENDEEKNSNRADNEDYTTLLNNGKNRKVRLKQN